MNENSTMPLDTLDTLGGDYADRLAQERRYVDQVALYTHAFGVKNSWSSRPCFTGTPKTGRGWFAGPGTGILMVDEAWTIIDPKGSYGPPVDPSHPENLYGTLGVDRCLADQARARR